MVQKNGAGHTSVEARFKWHNGVGSWHKSAISTTKSHGHSESCAKGLLEQHLYFTNYGRHVARSGGRCKGCFNSIQRLASENSVTV